MNGSGYATTADLILGEDVTFKFDLWQSNTGKHTYDQILSFVDWNQDGEFAYGPSLDGESTFTGFATPYLPAQNLQRCIRDGAVAWKLGKDTKRAILVEGDAVIKYDGPSDATRMYEDTRFVSVAPTGRGTMAVRVRIPHWLADYHLLVNDEIIDPQTLAKIIDRAGIAEGLGTWRPMHGRFQVTAITEVEMN